MTAKNLTVADTIVSAPQSSFSPRVIFQKLEEMEINKIQHNPVLGKSSIKINDDIKVGETI